MAKQFNNPMEELAYLRKKVCCSEDCMTHTLYGTVDVPNPLGAGDTYTVNVIVGGVTIATVFTAAEARAAILAALNLKFLNFKIIFTAATDGTLVATITDNKAACDVTMTTALIDV